MATFRPGTPDQTEFLDALIARGLLIPSGVPGVYGRGSAFEAVRVGVDRMIDRTAAPDGAELLRFPPLLPRYQLEALGYLKNFPHLAGTIFGFDGTELEANEQFELANEARGLERIPEAERPGPAACGVLSRLPGDRRTRAAGGRRLHDRRGRGLRLPSGAVR